MTAPENPTTEETPGLDVRGLETEWARVKLALAEPATRGKSEIQTSVRALLGKLLLAPARAETTTEPGEWEAIRLEAADGTVRIDAWEGADPPETWLSGQWQSQLLISLQVDRGLEVFKWTRAEDGNWESTHLPYVSSENDRTLAARADRALRDIGAWEVRARALAGWQCSRCGSMHAKAAAVCGVCGATPGVKGFDPLPPPFKVSEPPEERPNTMAALEELAGDTNPDYVQALIERAASGIWKQVLESKTQDQVEEKAAEVLPDSKPEGRRCWHCKSELRPEARYCDQCSADQQAPPTLPEPGKPVRPTHLPE